MSNPTSYVPYAIAAADGSVDGHSVRALVAAGSTLLQRCAPLVRALAGCAPVSLLPPGAAFVTALGASDGHALLVLEPRDEAGHRMALANAESGVVFTTSAFADRVPVGKTCVLLDRVPKMAIVRWPTMDERVIDLGSHVGLAIEGELNAPGSDEPVLRWYEHGTVHSASHRDVMSGVTGGWAGVLIRRLLTGRQDAGATLENV